MLLARQITAAPTSEDSTTKTCVVRSPVGLRYPMAQGSVSYNDSFDSPPTGSIRYEGVPSGTVSAIEGAYRIGTTVRFPGCSMPLRVQSVQTQETSGRVRGEGSGEWVLSYTVSISLAFPNLITVLTEEQETDLRELGELLGQVAYSDGLRAKGLDVGRGWRFSRGEVLEMGGATLGDLTEGYNEAVLEWGKPSGKRLKVVPKRPQEKTLVEQTKDPERAPEDTEVIKDLTSNHDESGPTKFIRRVTTIDGTPHRERQQTWGFAYLYEEATLSDGRLFSSNPQEFWRLIEERETRHIYRRINSVTLTVTITDPAQRDRALRYVVHPDFAQFIQVRGGRQITVTTPNLFLVESVTTGRKLLRLVKETEERNTLDPTDPRYPLMQWRWVPYSDRTVYRLRSIPKDYGVPRDRQEGESPGNQPLPFRVEWRAYKDLEPRLKSLFNERDASADGQVAILFPELGYVEPLYVEAQVKQALSYEWELDPDGEVEDADPPLPPKPPPHFMVGEETHNETWRYIVDLAESRYDELEKNYSAQDPQFKTVAETTTIREMRGSLPGPQVRKQNFETTELDPTARQRSSADMDQAVYVSTSNANDFRPGGSVRIAGANSLGEALQGLRVRLRRSAMKASQANYRVAWYYPAMRPGDSFSVEGQRWRSRGTLRITSLSWTHEYLGTNNPISAPGQPLIICRGMQVSCGLDPGAGVGGISHERRGRGAPTLSADLAGGDRLIGRILPPMPSRRNF